MSTKGIVGELVVVTSRLVELMGREAEALRQGKAKDAAALVTEKTQLVDAYVGLLGELRRDPAMFVSVAPALRGELLDATRRLHEAAGWNARAIRAARDVNARLMEAVVEAASAERMRDRGYGAGARAAQPGRGNVVSIAVDQRL